MTDLVVVSLERWDDVWRRNQYLVDGLLRGDPGLRVLFVEPAADPLHDIATRRAPTRGVGPQPIGDTGRLWRYRPVKALPRRVDPLADERLARSVARATRGLGFASPVLWLNDPGLAVLMESTGWPTLYDITDDWLSAERPQRELDRLARGEAALLRHAAAVVACSSELVRRKSDERVGTIELIPNAVDVAAYRSPHARPLDLPRTAAVYVGTLHTDRLDVELCVRTAAALAGRGRLVLVGPNALGTPDHERLRHAGVLLLGARSHDEVVAYLQHADVLVVPHLVTPFTDSLDPIKLYEYAAAGRRVVSTAVAGFRDSTDPRVRVVPASEFPAAIAAALTADDHEPTVEWAEHPPPGWSDRVRAMRSVLDRMGRA
jgi:teichuronic acid biosynthesis glycosyltransferase TuaH